MSASLFAAKSRLSKVAETLLLDHLGMMAPVIVEEVFSQVDASKPQSAQQLLTAFLLSLRTALPSDMDAEKVVNSIYARYLQG